MTISGSAIIAHGRVIVCQLVKVRDVDIPITANITSHPTVVGFGPKRVKVADHRIDILNVDFLIQVTIIKPPAQHVLHQMLYILPVRDTITIEVKRREHGRADQVSNHIG